MLGLETQTNPHPVIRLHTSNNLFDFITELFYTKHKTISLVEKIFIHW